MTRKVTTRTTPEERRERAAALQASIAEQVATLRESDQWRAFCDLTRDLHHYSLNNLMLIWSQRPDARAVAGFRQWQARGRQVRKGEKAIRIFGYATKKITDDDGDGDQGENLDPRLTEVDATGQRVRVYFPILSVFDVSQTDPVDPAGPDSAHLAQRLTGADPLDILGAVTDHLTAAGWTVTREQIPGETNGYTTLDGTRRVVIDADLQPAQAAKTALHEAAHAYLHAELAPGQHAEHRGTRETEAESVAYIVAGLLGLDTSSYTIGYVAGWSGADVDLIRSTAANVLRAAHHIAEAITTQHTADAAA